MKKPRIPLKKQRIQPKGIYKLRTPDDDDTALVGIVQIESRKSFLNLFTPCRASQTTTEVSCQRVLSNIESPNANAF